MVHAIQLGVSAISWSSSLAVIRSRCIRTFATRSISAQCSSTNASQFCKMTASMSFACRRTSRGSSSSSFPAPGNDWPDFSRAQNRPPLVQSASRFRRRQKTSWDALRNERSRLVLLMLQRHRSRTPQSSLLLLLHSHKTPKRLRLRPILTYVFPRMLGLDGEPALRGPLHGMPSSFVFAFARPWLTFFVKMARRTAAEAAAPFDDVMPQFRRREGPHLLTRGPEADLAPVRRRNSCSSALPRTASCRAPRSTFLRR